MRKSNTPVPPRIPAARAAAPAFMGQQGGNQHNWKSEKEENPQVFWVSGRAGPEECYFWTWITISWLVWVSVGGGARLIKADDLAQASSCGIKDHDKQLLRQIREPSKGTHGCSCRRSGARSPQDTALGHECRIPGTPGTFSHLSLHGWAEVDSKVFPTPWSPWCPQCSDTSHCVPQVALLEFASPSSSEQNSDAAFTKSNPRDPRKTLKHWEILNIPALLEVMQSPPLHQAGPHGAGQAASNQVHTWTHRGCPAAVNDVLPPATEKWIIWIHTPCTTQPAAGEVSPGNKDIPAWNFTAIYFLMFLASAGASAVDHCQEWDARLGKL